MFQLDIRSRKPLYEQLVDRIKEMVITNVLKQDEQLPSVRVLSSELTVNPNTVQRAYRELEQQGYIYSVKGKGNFVAAINESNVKEQLNDLLAEIQKLVAEAIFLGLTKEELVKIYYDAINREKEETTDASSKANNEEV
ncbi:GntR family transcriptional regulator [Metabacillus fastidiosus]|uniref:GntR family transcriptional regulator n=1 Tax=Metabacillus fastidiosus TaxID=1458 RepID=A0ABU6NXY1_9BACI|nr:GntR family transcriptional regulator [Metabacillus fastidiosus]